MDDIDQVIAELDALVVRSGKLADEATNLSPLRKAATPVALQRTSSNRKLAPQGQVQVGKRKRNVPRAPFCSSTYVSIEATCPDSCPYRGNGCYAQAGMAVQRLDRAATRRGWTPEATIEAEVEAIDGSYVRGVPQDGARGGRDLRLHVSGDCPDETSARVLAGAAARWQERGGGQVWTYTHAWRAIPREAWGPIAVLASVETRRDVDAALAVGYAPALTVDAHAGEDTVTAGGVDLTPCPAQTRGRTCVECRLCLDPALSERRGGVLFALHGVDVAAAKRRLRVLNA